MHVAKHITTESAPVASTITGLHDRSNNSIASVLQTASYCHETDYALRHNVLLVGDSLGDLHMSDGYVRTRLSNMVRAGYDVSFCLYAR